MKADAEPKAAKRRINWKVEIYRQSRAWHGYLSAFAFLALIFFAITGLLLNHPEWTTTNEEQPSRTTTVALAAADLARAQASSDPEKALGETVGGKTTLIGAWQSGEVIDGEAQLRFEGPKGSSDVVVDLATGKAEVETKRARVIDTINELHRGKNSGGAWKAVIDASAMVILLLSVIGYVLFFSLRFRLRTSLILTGVSLAGLVGVVVWFTP